MTRSGEREEATLWRRWRALQRDSAGSAAAEPDALTLAAYSEGRLDARRVEAVEAWLAENPDILTDLQAARDLAAVELAAPESMITRAAVLVAPGDGQVVPFPQQAPRSGNWRGVMAWASIAASLLITSLVGVSLSDYAHYESAARSSSAALPELLDPPGGLFNGVDEEPAT